MASRSPPGGRIVDRMNRHARTLLGVGLSLGLALAALGGCRGRGGAGTDAGPSGTIPSDKRAYLGSWEGPDTTFTFAEDGAIAFHKKSGASGKTVTGRFSRFDGDAIKVRVLIADVTLDVQAPPKQAGDGWTMTIEGVPVTRKGGAGTSARGPMRAQIEKGLRLEYEMKGVTVKAVSCPAEADHARSFTCTLTQGDDPPISVAATVDGKSWHAAPESAAAIDTKKAEEAIVADMEKRKLTATVRCSSDKLLLKPVGSTFQCDAKVTKPSAKDVKVDVEVKSAQGNIAFKYKT